MITEETARRIALSMPETKEGEHMDHPDFRIRKKIFATLWSSESRAVVFADPSLHAQLMDENPNCLSLNGWSEKYGALNVHLENVAESQFERLVIGRGAEKRPRSLRENHSQIVPSRQPLTLPLLILQGRMRAVRRVADAGRWTRK